MDEEIENSLRLAGDHEPRESFNLIVDFRCVVSK